MLLQNAKHKVIKNQGGVQTVTKPMSRKHHQCQRTTQSTNKDPHMGKWEKHRQWTEFEYSLTYLLIL